MVHLRVSLLSLLLFVRQVLDADVVLHWRVAADGDDFSASYLLLLQVLDLTGL
jgi:hypothetical protein